MKHIGIVSDTHGIVAPGILDFMAGMDEIWHAGDIGDAQVIHQLMKINRIRAVYGNIDGQDMRIKYPEIQCFTIEDVKVLMTHIGGYPGRYIPGVRQLIEKEKPKLFICGHSHILKVIYDPVYDLLHINPGAAGKYGIHKSITAIRLVIEGNTMRDLEVKDIPR
jgi:putative phosphoesterase